MVPDTRQRLETALADLQQCLVIMAFTSITQRFAANHVLQLHLGYIYVMQSQSNKVADSEEFQQAKLAVSDAEAILA